MASYDNQNLLAGGRTNGNISVVSSSSRGGGANSNVEAEKSPFLEKSEPVRLTPAWEENNLPNDELNFKGLTMERAKMQVNPPRDKMMLVFIVLMIHGIGTLMPWNMFITAKTYFVDYKLSENYTGSTDGSQYGTYFLSSLGFAAQIPNLIFNWLNIFVNLGGNLTKRIVLSIMVEVIAFIVTVILAMMNSSEWPGAFFWITMTTVVILNMASGIYQNSVYGMAAKLPFKYTGAVVLGSNVSGTFTSIILLLSSEFSSSPRTAAIYYFITAMFFLLLCFDTYFALPLNKYYRYHELMKEKEMETNQRMNPSQRPPYWTIFKQAFPQLFNVFFVFFVTLSIFPAVHSDVKRVDNDFLVPEKHFAGICCFLTFNLCAMLGSLATSWVQWPKPKYLVWPVVLRVIFLPLFLFCNYQPLNITRVLPVYISNDWVFWGLGIVMSFSSGYLSSLGMMYAPQSVEPRYAMTAGMFAAAMLITGIFTGLLFTRLCPMFVQHNFLDWLN